MLRQTSDLCSLSTVTIIAFYMRKRKEGLFFLKEVWYSNKRLVFEADYSDQKLKQGILNKQITFTKRNLLFRLTKHFC